MPEPGTVHWIRPNRRLNVWVEGVFVSCDGSGVTVYTTYLCGYIALYLREVPFTKLLNYMFKS